MEAPSGPCLEVATSIALHLDGPLAAARSARGHAADADKLLAVALLLAGGPANEVLDVFAPRQDEKVRLRQEAEENSKQEEEERFKQEDEAKRRQEKEE